ncbi:hypothetical protein QJS04_geneDACA001424 [Acorus gramineus]|uniref:Tetrapyrrole biosynthesis uroporphyrinogen III synthase domain-containing protein n=1 Tax=Acorus gramineus TaxID=55184 RepID=A0AAV9A6N1_ACOGR|nr:hypothetical protein QJS04_geneDACA001424 [Acorus gramineus]
MRPPPPLSDRRVAFTTPEAYARRLRRLLELQGASPLWFPTVTTGPTPLTSASLKRYLHRRRLQNPIPNEALSLDSFSALAFTSRTGISAFSAALSAATPLPLSDKGEAFTVAALGRDAELLDQAFLSKLCGNPNRIRVLVPEVASPGGLVDSLGPGLGRRVLCPVPLVVDLEEPPVVPDFLNDLELSGWVPVRVPAYETRWAGPGCAEGLVGLDGPAPDAVVFTSTAEVEGLLKGLRVIGWDWTALKARWQGMVTAAHGPVTASGAERLGVCVDIVGSRFGSFDGVVEALADEYAFFI